MSDIYGRIHFDRAEQKLIRERVQDVEPILSLNSELRALGNHTSDWGRHIANIPNIIYEQWFNEYNAGRAKPDFKIFGAEFAQYVDRKLKDPEWKFLRTDI